MPVGTSKFDRTNPTTPDDAGTIPTAANDCVGLLNGALAADAYGNNGASQELRLIDASAFPSAGWVTVGSEIISYTGKSGNTLTGIARGAQSTTIKAHVSRSACAYNFTAAHLNVLIAAVISLQTMMTKLTTDSGTTDGTNTIALSGTPITGPKVLLFVNGVAYSEGVDFDRSGSNLVWKVAAFPVPPPAGNPYIAFYIAQ